MWFKVVLLVLSLSQLELGAAQQCEGFVGVLGITPDQLKKEIRANIGAALKEDAAMNSENETCLNQEELNTTLEKAVDVAIEKLISTMEKTLETKTLSYHRVVSVL